MIRNIVAIVAMLVALFATFRSVNASAPVILYSPDSLVDTNPTVGYVEPAIAADTANSKVMVAAAESAQFSTVGAFVSRDGGYNWHPSAIALGNGSLMGDVQLAADVDGSIYFTALGSQPAANGRALNGLHVFVSRDRGDSFQHVAFLQNNGHSYDHEQLAVDDTRSPYRGRLYMSVLYSLRIRPQLNACGLLRSDASGRHFYGPVRVIDGWCFNSRPQVLSNGTVVFPFFISGKPGDAGTPSSTNLLAHIEIAASRDGGKSFGAPRVIGTVIRQPLADFYKRMAAGQTDFDGDPVPQLAVGISPVTHRDAIYAAWSDMRTGRSRLLFTASTDGGSNWTTPRTILTTGDVRDTQYQVSMAVNRRGILGVAYLQRAAGTNNVAEMFADSTTGGRTFSAPIQIQSVASKLGFSKYSGFSAMAEHVDKDVFVGFVQPEHRFPSGGDYTQMTVGADGAFHPVWADSRTGTYQIWTASVYASAPPTVQRHMVASDVSKEVDLQFGAGSWDPITHVFSAPVRLHNASTHAIYPPFTVTISKLYDPFIPESMQPRPWPSFENADNGKSGVGAVYGYTSSTLGNLGVLSPGANSAPRIWKVRLAGANMLPSVMVRVSGYAAQ